MRLAPASLAWSRASLASSQPGTLARLARTCIPWLPFVCGVLSIFAFATDFADRFHVWHVEYQMVTAVTQCSEEDGWLMVARTTGPLHVLTFAALGVCCFPFLRRRPEHGASLRRPADLLLGKSTGYEMALLACVAVGVGSEILQGFTIFRVPMLTDALLNILSAMAGLVVLRVLKSVVEAPP